VTDELIYLSGTTNDTIEALLIAAGIGLMIQPGNGYASRVLRFGAWAADNGCFAAKWVEDRWIKWLELLPLEGCLFAVAPDVYPDATESLRRGLEFAPILRDMGFRVAVVAQNGAEDLDWPWDEIDCLFIGGMKTIKSKDEWKLSNAAADLAHTARNAGKQVHMGRVNSYKRLERAREMGCTSVDGTYIAKGPNLNVKRMSRFLSTLDYNQPLPLRRFEGVTPLTPAQEKP
jgi:hypothetical protein